MRKAIILISISALVLCLSGCGERRDKPGINDGGILNCSVDDTDI
jgi:hypothetical protein